MNIHKSFLMPAVLILFLFTSFLLPGMQAGEVKKETWNLTFSSNLKGNRVGPMGSAGVTMEASGSAKIVITDKEILSGKGTMNVVITYEINPANPSIKVTPLRGKGTFEMAGKRDGKNLVVVFKPGAIKCEGTMTVTLPGLYSETSPFDSTFDPASVLPCDERLDRREGASTQVEVKINTPMDKINGKSTITLSGGKNVKKIVETKSTTPKPNPADPNALSKGGQPNPKFTAKKNLWVLEMEFTSTTKAPTGMGGVSTTVMKIKGEAEFPLPLGEGPAKGEGPLSFTTESSGIASMKNTGKGRLILDGTVVRDEKQDKDILTFVPRATLTTSKVKTGSMSADAGFGGMDFFNTDESVSLPVEKGSELVQKSAQDLPGGGHYSGEMIWRLKGKKLEVWQITLDGYDTSWKGDHPTKIPKPKGYVMPKAKDLTGDSYSVPEYKWSSAVGGLESHWRLDIIVEIEEGKYKKGEWEAVLVSVKPYCKPDGIYTVKSLALPVLDQWGKTIGNTPVVEGPKASTEKGQFLSKKELILDIYYPSAGGKNVDHGYHVAYKCTLNEAVAEKVIAYYSTKNMRKSFTGIKY